MPSRGGAHAHLATKRPSDSPFEQGTLLVDEWEQPTLVNVSVTRPAPRLRLANRVRGVCPGIVTSVLATLVHGRVASHHPNTRGFFACATTCAAGDHCPASIISRTRYALYNLDGAANVGCILHSAGLHIKCSYHTTAIRWVTRVAARCPIRTTGV